MGSSDAQKRCREADGMGKPDGDAEPEEQEHSNGHHNKNNSQGDGREQAHHLVYCRKLHVFLLKPKIVFEHLNELCYRLNVLIARQHALFGNVLNVVDQVAHFLAVELDVVLLHEVLNGICDFHSRVASLFGSHEHAQNCAGDSTAEKCANVT